MANLSKIDRVFFGRSEVPVTVFVPWDCRNSCKFCTTKHEYKSLYPMSKLDENMEKVKESIRKMTDNDFVTDVVFTGGEPFADVGRLEELIDEVQRPKRIFVNTSFSVSDDEFSAALKRLSSKRCKIDSVSVSCPFDGGLGNLDRLHALAKFKDKEFFRLNSVVEGNEKPAEVEEWLKAHYVPVFREVSFRADYRKTTQSSLHSANDKFFKTLMSIPELRYMGFIGCLVCRTDMFESKYGKIAYHRGTNSTSMKFGDALVVNDFVIKQDGEMRFDWESGCTMTEELLESFGIMH